MPIRSAGTFFAQLIPAILSDLKRIAGRSNGEVTVDDLQSEAWLAAEEIGSRGNVGPDPTDKAFHKQILSRLYNRFVKFADKRLRFAIRLDEEHEDEEGESRSSHLAAVLAAPQEYEPSQALELQESDRSEEQELLGRFAEAVAYIRVLTNMGNDRQAVCDHLAIGASTLHRRMARAEHAVNSQHSLFDGITVIPVDFMPPRLFGRVRRGAFAMESGLSMRRQSRLFIHAYIPIRLLARREPDRSRAMPS